MTLNAWFQPPLRERAAEIAAWIAAVAPHVVCLQEVCRPEGQAETLADLIASALPGPWHLAFAGAPARSGGLAGPGVMSRWPVQASEVLPLPGEDALPKSVLHARTGGLDVFSAHLASAPTALAPGNGKW
jgi:endonuclease/exonuclease/phosphatase family metal-dependent hydrolase